MDNMSICQTTIHGKKMTSICIGESSGDLPLHLMTGEKAVGFIVHGDTVEPWLWEAIRDRDGKRYIDGPVLPLIPFVELSKSLRNEALQRLRQLATAFMKVPANFIHPSGGMIETWRIFFLEEEGVLILPVELSQIMLYSVSEETKFTHVSRYMKPDTEPPFGLCHQFSQFLYLACAGFAPYEAPDVREDHFRHLPLSTGFSGIDADFAQWIDHTLSMEPRVQRETVSAAYSAEDNLTWFLDSTANFRWDPQYDTVAWEEVVEKSPSVATFVQQQRKRAERRRFLRRRGALLATIALLSILVLTAVGNMVYDALQPPYTARMSAYEVVEEFFSSQNNLDLAKMDASLTRSARNPFETEVSSLFVNTKVRQAYEGFNAVIRADQWIAEGRPPIPESSLVYGVVDLDIVAKEDNRYRATYLIYYPSAEPDEEGFPTTVDVIERVTDFQLTQDRGFWQIEEITPIEATRIGVEKLITHPRDLLTVD
jgi:hypothetical protein